MSYALIHAESAEQYYNTILNVGSKYSNYTYPVESEHSLEMHLIANGKDMGMNDANEFDNIVQYRMVMSVRERIFYQLYLLYKKTYILDQHFYNTLSSTESVRIYPSVLQTIPFHSFAIDISNCKDYFSIIYCNVFNNHLGVFCSFLGIPKQTENNPTQFNVHINTDNMKLDEKGLQYFELTAKSADIVEHDYTKLTGFKNKIVGLIKKHETSVLEETKGNEQTNELKRTLMQFIYYLCTPEPDIYESKQSRNENDRLMRLKKPESERVYHVGSRIGQKIRIGTTIVNEQGESIQTNAGTTKCPHIRGAHWTHVWCGPKSSPHLETRFIETCFVNFGIGEFSEVTNVVTDSMKKTWAGEEAIKRVLSSLNIKYSAQSPVVIDGHRYRFDVSFKTNNGICYIEFDGEQHFKPVAIYGGQEGFERTVKADNIKNQYCKQHNIPLLRIKFNEMSEIDAKIRNFVKEQQLINNIYR